MIGIDGASVIAPDDRVLFPLNPHHDESYFGFTSRLASWNCFENRRGFLRALGVKNLNLSDIHLAADDDGRLARQLGITHEQLGRLTARAMGVEYRKELHIRKRRVSPRGLNESLYHRSIWTISRLPYCPVAWDTLLGICPDCAHELGWAFLSDVHLCDRCGFDLRRVETPTVPVDCRERLSFLADLVEVDPMMEVTIGPKMPAALAGEIRLRVFQLSYLFGRALAFHRTKSNFFKASPLTQVKHLAMGVEMLQKYPKSFDVFLIEGNGQQPKQFQQLRETISERTECRPLLDRLLADWEPGRCGTGRVKRGSEDSDCLTVREAAKNLRIENAAVRRLIDLGLIAPLNSGRSERRYDLVSSQDVRLVANQLASRLSVREFSRSHHIPPSGVLQLMAAGLISLNKCPIVTAIHGNPQLIQSDANAFISRLRSVVHFRGHNLETVSLTDAFQGIGGQQKPWSAILLAALERRLELYWEGDPHATLSVKDLQLSKRVAWDLLARRRPELLETPTPDDDCLVQTNLSRGEAEQYLNCFQRDLAWLICTGRIPEELPSDRIASLGRELISSREISWRWRVSPALRDALATDHGIPRCAGPFWPRPKVEAFFARRFPLGEPI